MKDAQRPDHISLNSLINRLKDGRYQIPDFQREFEWMPWDVQQLLKSIFLDYYIGSLLLWKGKPENFEMLSCENIYGHQGSASPEYIVLDGQQRLTALYYACFAPDLPLPNRRNRFYYFIRADRFMAQEFDDAFLYDWTGRANLLRTNRAAQYEYHSFPLSVIGEGGWALANWMQGYEAFWRERANELRTSGLCEEADQAENIANDAKEFGEHVREVVERYQVSFVELDKDLEIEKVCDIFTQVNSRGVRLDIFDLINALLKPKGLQLKHLWRQAASRLNYVDSSKQNVYVLQVMSILAQSYCSPKYLYYLLPGQQKKVRDPDGKFRFEVLVPSVQDFERRWNHAVDAMTDAINVLRHPNEFGAISAQFVPYDSIIPCFSALRAQVADLPPERRLVAHRRVRQWYWASVFLNRYSGAVESTAAKDYQEVLAWFEDDDAQPSAIREFAERYRSIDLKGERKKGSSIYNGVFNLLVIHGAKDWATGDSPHFEDLDDHHIIPISWAKENGLDPEVHSILNRTPLSADTNRNVIRERLPNRYLPEMIASSGESAVRAVLETHLISPRAFDILLRDPFSPSDFEQFLTERLQSIHGAVQELLIKERLDLSPDLRSLDQSVEECELRLRTLIDQKLQGDPAALPSHVAQKLDERIERAVRKNAAMDGNRYTALASQLEFADLRELQDIITNGGLWVRFEATFRSKDTLIKKCDQLAELRNSIRHSRAVDRTTKLEGEAALHWFEEVLTP